MLPMLAPLMLNMTDLLVEEWLDPEAVSAA